MDVPVKNMSDLFGAGPIDLRYETLFIAARIIEGRELPEEVLARVCFQCEEFKAPYIHQRKVG